MHTNDREKVANESVDVFCWPLYCTVVTNILVADQFKLQYLVSHMYIRNEVSCIVCLCSFFKMLCFFCFFLHTYQFDFCYSICHRCEQVFVYMHVPVTMTWSYVDFLYIHRYSLDRVFTYKDLVLSICMVIYRLLLYKHDLTMGDVFI